VLQKLTYTLPEKGSSINIQGLNERFKHVCFFDSNLQINKGEHLQIAKIIAIGATEELIISDPKNALSALQEFYNKRKGWLFGYLTYDLKNEIENLSSKNSDGLGFPLLHFFAPKVVIQINASNISVSYDDELVDKTEAEKIYTLCVSPPSLLKGESIPLNEVIIQSKIKRSEYMDSVNQLKQRIRKGDIYEVNFCQEFFAENVNLNTIDIFENLNKISQAPFTAYCKFDTHYVICASPERFLQKHGNRLISQPIKGTVKRSENEKEDELLKFELQNSNKEKSENVMIVDLVRNDLSRIAKQGSVKVDELFGIYSFKQLHQMISTVSCEINDDISFTDIIKSLFPMGSMTGAPKVSAMKLIKQYESTKRSLYSGSIGYITPEGDFDFNVVIRSILYNSKNKYASFMVGSAITDKAIAEEEYEECLLKAKAMFEVLRNN
jgi:para-aminobenzoate synthetase component I